MLKPYWCFICRKQFTADFKEMIECPFCHEQAFEEVTSNNHPQQFEIYQRATENAKISQIPELQTYRPRIQPASIHLTQNDYNFIFSGILSNLPTIMNDSIRILNYMMQALEESGQRYRRASQREISALEKIGKPKECSICQLDEIEGHNESYRLRCGHEFHILCIQPWFQKANTCPTCRTELTPRN